MEILGVVFLVIIAMVVILGLIVAAISLPDIARYRRIRRL